MYEFAPKLKKTREKIVMSVCLLLSSIAYGVSGFLPYPALYQILTVLLLTVAVLVIVRYLLRDYVYYIREDDNGGASELTVVEWMGKKQTVVCRVSLDEVENVFPRTVFAQSGMRRGNEIYRYVSELFPENGFFVEVLSGEKQFFVEICADRTLVDLISSYKRKDLSDLRDSIT